MNRPTRRILFGCVLCLDLVVCLTLPAKADSQLEQQAKAIRKNFDDCFYGSAVSQLKRSVVQDINSVSEQAFLACSTEEQALISFLILNHMSPSTASAAITGLKIGLKKTMREIATHPERYAN